MTCPLCAASGAEVFLARDNVPVHQNVLFGSAAAARRVQRGALRMAVCDACGFVFNAAFEPAKITYASGYDNDQTFSPSFDRYVDTLVERIRSDIGIDGRTIAEIGCGTGYFLRRLVAAGAGTAGVGYDPSYSGEARSSDGRLEFIAGPFAAGGRHFDLVICRHVIEHIAAPLPFASAIGEALTDGSVVFETPSIEWILRHDVIWDFFYEHCSLFSAASLSRLLERARFGVTSAGSVFNGQYLWVTGRAGGAAAAGVPRDDGTAVAAACRRFATVERDAVTRWSSTVERAARQGAVAVWGAGAKGATFLSLLDPAAERIACVVDVNPRKQGRFIAGTGHRVVAPAELPSDVATIVVMNPNYAAEIRARATATAPNLTFVTP